jgi:hypothetical protein
MKLPFALNIEYSSPQSVENVFQFIQELDKQKSKYFGFDLKDYTVKSTKPNFEFTKNKRKGDTSLYPTVVGSVQGTSSGSHLTIEIKPDIAGLVILAFFGLLSALWVLSALTALIKSGSFILWIPTAVFLVITYFFYNKNVNPIWETKEWLEEALDLEEI